MQSFRIILASVIYFVMAVSPSVADAAGSTSLVISEVMTAGSDNASNEFIELYNPSGSAITVVGWAVEYKSATSTDTGSNWTKKATLSGVVGPHGFYLIAPRSLYPDADSDWTATLAGTAGNIRLKDEHGLVIDQLGYGATANAAEGSPAVAPQAGQSIERLPGRLNEGSGNMTDTNNNAMDFMVRLASQPQSTKSAAEDPSAAIPGDTHDELPDDGTPPVLPLQLTELLPNPASPLTDADDEFIEIYNPNSVPVHYGGYKLKGGSDFHTSYTLPDGFINAGEYLVFTSNKTHIAMSNTGGAVQLIDADGALIDQTQAYGTAPDGQSWARVGDNWQWTLQPTPGGENIILAAATTSTASAKAATAKAAKAKAPVSKSSSKKATSTKATKSKALPKTKKAAPLHVAAAQLRPVTWLIIMLTLLTIGYALYEFRYDLQNFYFKLRRDGKDRGTARESSSRRRND